MRQSYIFTNNMPEFLLINNAEKGITTFVNPIVKIIDDLGFTSVIIQYKDCLKTDKECFDGIILSGSPQGNDIVEHHLPWFKWLKNYKKPVLGICAGHHIAGFLYKSKLLRGEEAESGDFFVDISNSDPILNSMPLSFNPS